MMSFGVIGVSVRGGNMPLLEALVPADQDRASRLAELKARCEFEELAPVYTCNRAEFYYLTKEGQAGLEYRNRLLDFFLADKKIAFEPSDITSLTAFRALRHLYRVASSLDSLVVGESQILGQVKSSLAEAQAMGLAGPRLTNIFSDAFRVSRKVRRETPLGQYAVSMINLVLESIDQHLVGRDDPRIALIGVGPMCVKLAGQLRERGQTNLVFVNRTESKAAELASRFGSAHQSLESFLSGPTHADIIFSSTGSSEPIFTPATMTEIIPAPGGLLMIDLAIPRDIDLAPGAIDGVTVLDISHFRSRAESHRRERFLAVDAAERIIDEAIGRAHMVNAERSFRPVMASALNEGLAYAETQMRRLFETRLAHLTATDREAVAHFVRQLVQYNNHLPMEALVQQADIGREDCALIAGYECVEDRCGDEDPANPMANRCSLRDGGVCLGKAGNTLDAL